ncbi:MAG: aminoacyl-tRNA hydrolase [Anaerolineales bacterium]|nr:aminoacyl-tRNA hydrolase [Anaerolineales bacterium]
MIEVTDQLSIDDSAIHLDYVQASGPGGQNVNKVASAVQLRFDALTPDLPEDVRLRLMKLAARRINEQGVLIIQASRYRTQEKNRQDAIDRLVSLLQRAAQKPKVRRKTRPTLESQKRRLEAKRQRSQIKRSRSQPPPE